MNCSAHGCALVRIWVLLYQLASTGNRLASEMTQFNTMDNETTSRNAQHTASTERHAADEPGSRKLLTRRQLLYGALGAGAVVAVGAGAASAACVASGLASAACVGACVGAGVACTGVLPQPAERSTRESRIKTASNFFIFIDPYASCRLSIQAFSSRSEARAEKRLPLKTFAPFASASIRLCPSPRLLPPEVKNGTMVLPETS